MPRRSVHEIQAKEKGIGFPFLRGHEGILSRRFGLNVLVDDLIALLYIRPGEYPHEPELGVGIEGYLFELNDPILALLLEQKIDEQVRRFITGLTLEDVSVEAFPEQRLLVVTITARRTVQTHEAFRVSLDINSQTLNVSLLQLAA